MFHWVNKVWTANTWKISDINWRDNKFGIFTISRAFLLFKVLWFMKLLQYLCLLPPWMHNPWDKRGGRRCQDMLLECWFLSSLSHKLQNSITQKGDIRLLDVSYLLALKLNLLDKFYQSYLKTAVRRQAMAGQAACWQQAGLAASCQSLDTSTGPRQAGAQMGNPKPEKMWSFSFK